MNKQKKLKGIIVIHGMQWFPFSLTYNEIRIRIFITGY